MRRAGKHGKEPHHEKPTVNLLIDAVAVLLMLGMLTTGFVLRFPLPPGTNRSYLLWGLTRHEWEAFTSGAVLGSSV